MTKELLPIYLYFIIEEIIPLIISEYNLSENEAIQKFGNYSDVYPHPSPQYL